MSVALRILVMQLMGCGPARADLHIEAARRRLVAQAIVEWGEAMRGFCIRGNLHA